MREGQVVVLEASNNCNTIVVGVFTDMEKAKKAAICRASQSHKGVKEVCDRDHEVYIVCHDGTSLKMCYWQLDKALIDGEWIQI